MKAKFVYENLDFERNQDPKKALRIGKWIEIELEEVMKDLVDEYGGSYEIERSGQGIDGFYTNDMFSSGGRSLNYDFETGKFGFSFPDLGQYIPIDSIEKFKKEVWEDLETRVKEGGVPEQRW